MTKVVILAGGKGTRISELTNETPKPMLMVGDKPIIQHIIDKFVLRGFREFIIPVGYLGHKIREYFGGKYRLVENLWFNDLLQHSRFIDSATDVTINVVDTGADTLTGGRILRLKEYLKDEPFLMTYGDGISNINASHIVSLAKELNKNVVTAVHPIPRFGAITISPTLEVLDFSEKSSLSNEWINGGFMYLKPEILDLIKGDTSNFEKDVLPKVVWESGLFAFQYEGYWHCCDTLRDLQQLNEDYKKGLF